MKVIGYIRVSTDKQDLEKQKHLLLEYAQSHHLLISEFINIEISSRKNTQERRIDELLLKLQQGDMLLVAESSRLGRNMLVGLNLTSVRKIINHQLEKPLSYNSYKYFVRHEADLSSIWQVCKENTASEIVTKAINYSHL